MNGPQTPEERTPAEPRPTREGPPPGAGTMAVVRWVLVVVTAAIALGSILNYFGVRVGTTTAVSEHLYYCPMHPSVVQDHPGECPICSMTLVPKPGSAAKPSPAMKPAATTIPATAAGQSAAGGYYCPMHPNRTSDDPNARCPDCGMKLEPRLGAKTEMTRVAAAPSEQPTLGVTGLSPVELTPDRVQLIGMRTAPVQREPLGGELRTVGVVAASERGLAQVNTRFSGWIQKLLVSETGQRVRRGQILATIYSPDVLRAEQELLLARGWNGPSLTAPPRSRSEAAPGIGASTEPQSTHEHDSFTATLDANARRRLELLGISAPEINDILRTGKAIEAIAIRSPVDGYVVGKNAVAGVAVQPGTVLFEVADLSGVWVTAEIYEMDVSRIRVGQNARLELASYPGETYLGKVQFIHPMVDSGTRTLRVRVEFKNRSDRNGPRLRPGMYGTVFLDLPSTTGLMVPAEAVVDTGDNHYLFVSKGNGHFEPRTIKLGARMKDRVEVLSGVAAGETVVTTGNFLIDSESRLRAAIEGQAGPVEGGSTSSPSTCDVDFDAQKYPSKVQACRACELQHRGMGTMEEDCKKTIPKPWH